MRRLRAGAAPLLLAVAIGAACVAPDDRHEAARILTGGDPAAGRRIVERVGCAACHTIEGLSGARGLVGPRLNGLRERIYIAGVLPNGPDELVRWLQDPRAVDSATAMPSMNLTEQEARDVASYLYTLRR